MKKLVHVMFLLSLIFCSVYARADEVSDEVLFDAVALTGATIVPAQEDIVLLGIRAYNTSADSATVRTITITYTGMDAANVAAGSARLYDDNDGEWASDDRRQIGAGMSFSGNTITFEGVDREIASGAAAFFLFVVNAASVVPDENIFGAIIASNGDVTLEGASAAGSFPLKSLDEDSRFCVDVTANRITAGPWTTALVAGQEASFTVTCVDDYGNIDKGWDRTTLSISGAPGYEPGNSAGGNAPVYTGGGKWVTTEDGVRACAYRLFKVESGRKIRVSDPELGYVDSAEITVSGEEEAAPVEKKTVISIGSISSCVAGTPLNITLFATDNDGKAVSHAGSTTTVYAVSCATASPAGYVPVFPVDCCWDGSETSGQKTVQVTLYCAGSGITIGAKDTDMGSAVSNPFSVSASSVSCYTVNGPSQAALRSPVTYYLCAYDAWGNTVTDYAGTASISGAALSETTPLTIDFAAGIASLCAAFSASGAQSFRITDTAHPSISYEIRVDVAQPLPASRITIALPPSIAAGRPFDASISVCDAAENVCEDFAGTVSISCTPPVPITPARVAVTKGVWNGTLTIPGETLSVALTLSCRHITTAAAATIKVIVDNYENARAYPTVFSPRKERVKLRYYLMENSGVTVTIYNMLMEPVREMRFSSGGAGGSQGINIIEWDGRGGDDNSFGHSGGYHILIDKGSGKDWTACVIKNY